MKKKIAMLNTIMAGVLTGFIITHQVFSEYFPFSLFGGMSLLTEADLIVTYLIFLVVSSTLTTLYVPREKENEMC